MRLEAARQGAREVRAILAERIEQGVLFRGPEALGAPSVVGTDRSSGPTRRFVDGGKEIVPWPVALAVGVAVKGDGDYGVAVRIRTMPGERAPAERIVDALAGRSDIDIRPVGEVRAQSRWYRGVVRPLRIGPSVGHYAITAGTLGGFATVIGEDGLFALSNNHVLADADRGRPGDPILQPGPMDNPAPDDLRIGVLHTAVAFDPGGTNMVDCALARLREDIDVEPAALWNVARLRGTREAFGSGSDIVFKIGRTTGLTWGRITAIELDGVPVRIGSTVFTFDGQIEVEGVGASAFSQRGDSGSLVVDPEGSAIGLLFAGSTRGGRNGKGVTYLNPIDRVLEGLNARLVT